jgi:hypothetical protein
MTFITEMDKIIGISEAQYLKQAKKNAKSYGYNTKYLTFSKNPKYKLSFDGIDFGSALHLDFLLYNAMEKTGLSLQGEAEKHRNNYMKRASKIKGDWRYNPRSKNNLSSRIIWDANFT